MLSLYNRDGELMELGVLPNHEYPRLKKGVGGAGSVLVMTMPAKGASFVRTPVEFILVEEFRIGGRDICALVKLDTITHSSNNTIKASLFQSIVYDSLITLHDNCDSDTEYLLVTRRLVDEFAYGDGDGRTYWISGSGLGEDLMTNGVLFSR